MVQSPTELVIVATLAGSAEILDLKIFFLKFDIFWEMEINFLICLVW